MKIYSCGICKHKTTRKGLRKHLREEHFIRTELTKANAWRTEEFK